METINDVLHFLNQMKIFKIESGIEYIVFNNMRKILIDEFEDVDLDKLIEMIRTLDELYMDYLRMKVYFDTSIVKTLRDKIFEMYEQKMIERTDNA